MSALCMVISNPQQMLLQRPTRTKKTVGLGRSLVIPFPTRVVWVTPLANGTGWYKTLKYFSNKGWTCTTERQMEKDIWWCQLELEFGGSHLLKAFTQAWLGPVFFSKLWRSFQIYGTFSSSLHSYRRVHPSSYCITFSAIPFLLLSSLSICLRMHQVSHAAKQGRKKTKRCCTYNAAGLSGLQKTHAG